ncbi:MAG: hypothetical protein LBF87_03935 [Treponema sp.]|jgi:hypothetical protein|nr:hypothetical protein [Treponema sp.]
MPVATPQEKKAPTFEEVWALIQEVGEKQKETAAQMRETDRRMQETDRKFEEVARMFKEHDRKFEAQREESDRKFETQREESDRKFETQREESDRKFEAQREESDRKFEAQKEEHDRIIKELSESQKKTQLMLEESKRIVDKVSEELGNIGLNIGHAAESYFYTALAKSLTFGNICFDEVIPNLKKERKGASCEFDIVMVNHEAVAIIEVKHRVHPSLPEKMATSKVKQFRAFFPEYSNYTLYLGVAGLSMDNAVVEHARAFGVGVLKQDGDAIESFDVPLKAY